MAVRGTPASSVSHDPLSSDDMTREFVSELLRTPHKEGYFDSPVDGIYQRLTQNGINRYAKNNGLPFGHDFMTLEVVSALSIYY